MKLDDAYDVILTLAAKEAFARTLKRLTKKGPTTIDAQLVEARLCSQARKDTQVKTLLSPNTHVYIEEFYCSPSLRRGKNRFTPSNSDDFDDHALIEGVAGQGKSILLRHLCATSVLKLGRIALYYELRRLDHIKPLPNIVFESLTELGLPGNSEALKSLSAERDVELYLDGFDELTQKDAEKIDRDIDFITRTYPFVRLFVTSRPHIELSKNSNLTSYRIDNLNHVDIYGMIDKLCPENGLAEGLKTKLRSHPGKALDLLETPLLVTLLVAQYRQTQQIPDQLWEFYDSIFSVLFERHDSFKTPFSRKKRLNSTTHTYRKIFDQFCYGTLFADSLDTERTLKIAEWALQPRKLEGRSEDFLRDITDISSLVNEDDNFWTFIHNSIQEFHAARYLLSGTDIETRKNAELLTQMQNVASRDQVLRFAREIDEFRSLQFIELPVYERLTEPLEMGAEISDADCEEWLKKHATRVCFERKNPGVEFHFNVITDWPGEPPIRMYALRGQADLARKAIDDASPIKQLSTLLTDPVFRARLVGETRKRLQPIMEKRRRCFQEISERAADREQNSNVLQHLLEELPFPGRARQ